MLESTNIYAVMSKQKQYRILFRIDDVNSLTKELKNVSEIFLQRKIPITYAVEPGNVTDKCVSWLKNLKQEMPELIGITQHGWDHSKYQTGEFDNTRTFEEQFGDLKRGRNRLKELFGEDFFPMLTIPFGVFNRDTIRAADQLGFRVFCIHFNYRLSRRLFYKLGHTFGKIQIFGKKVSNHMRYMPGTNMFEIDSALSFVKKYKDDYGTECSMYAFDEMMVDFAKFQKYITTIVILLHHRYHCNKESLNLVKKVVEELEKRQEVTFSSYSQVYREHKG